MNASRFVTCLFALAGLNPLFLSAAAGVKPPRSDSGPNGAGAPPGPRMLDLDLRTRDPESDKTILKREKVDSSKIGVVIVDPWNYHWCMTACERVSAMTPRWNRALECARRLGMPVVWAPSDVVGSYAGWPQRERALATPLLPVPKEGDIAAKFTAAVGACMCGPGVSCLVNYGHDGINPDLVIAEEDAIISTTEEVYSLLKARGVTHVIYMGLHTNMCLYGKPGALKYLVEAGMPCVLARDINDAFTHYDPKSGFTPDDGTRQTDEDLERAGVPTINMVEELRKAGVWNDEWIVETVRIAPWGKPQRPCFFQDSETVTLTTPWLEGVEIRYTLNGRQPASDSPLYEKPLSLEKATTLRAAAFRDGKRVSLVTDAYFVRMNPVPPPPDLYLDSLTMTGDPFTEIAPSYAACFWQPKVNASFEGKPLRVRGRAYAKGLGMRAPSGVRLPVKPECERFVALAGIDDNMLDEQLGRNLAKFPSVVFRVFVDGALAAESPVIRISQEPWRFDVGIPEGARFVHLAAMDAGSRNVLDLGNWIETGFVLKDDAKSENAASARYDGPWEDAIPVPGYWEQAPGGKWAHYDGFAWYRCYVKAPASWAGKDLQLHVERVDNYHTAYFNGVRVGHGDHDADPWNRYKVPAARVRPGEYNMVAVRVQDWGGAGGFKEESPVLYAGDEAIELKGVWEFRTGDDPSAWRQWPRGVDPPAVGRFERVVSSRSVPRRENKEAPSQ